MNGNKSHPRKSCLQAQVHVDPATCRVRGCLSVPSPIPAGRPPPPSQEKPLASLSPDTASSASEGQRPECPSIPREYFNHWDPWFASLSDCKPGSLGAERSGPPACGIQHMVSSLFSE